jgi:hypothetical protein
MEELPNDVFQQMLSYLTDDAASVGRLSLCSSSLYDRIAHHSPELWKTLITSRWSVSQTPQKVEYLCLLEYIRRHTIDQQALKLLTKMAIALQTLLNLDDDNHDKVDGSSHIGQAWEHPSWKILLGYRSDVVDALRFQARGGASGHVRDRLLAFLAARTLQNIQFAECLYEWRDIQELQQDNEENSSDLVMEDPQYSQSILLERYALLISQIQQTPPQLLNVPDVTQVIRRRLDEMADDCRQRIADANATTVLDRILIVRTYLVNTQQFTGNADDYYNYRNSLLQYVLESKKGIPITLCILYTCICRRLDLNVHLTGLPGHVVLRFYNNNDLPQPQQQQPQFLDVFHEGQLLTVDDCHRICASYGVAWDVEFLNPLTPSHVLTRMLNNLTNCHFHAMAASIEAFHSDLFFQQRALASIHRQPPGRAGPLVVERVTQELPLTFSPDLLRYYGLLSPLVRPPAADEPEE